LFGVAFITILFEANRDSDTPSVLVVLTFALTFLLFMALAFMRPKVIKLEQKRRDDYALLLFNAAKAGDIQTFAVFLRPFYTTKKIRDYVQTQVYTGSGWMTTTQEYQLEQTIVEALDKLMPVVALGKPGEAIGVGRILINESIWRNAAAQLMDHATLIICIPSTRPGSEWELEEILRHGYLAKSVFIMPRDPSFLWFKWKMMRDDWARVAGHMKDRGVAIPDYKRSGLVFSIRPLVGCSTERFYLPSPKTLRDAITKLSSSSAGPLGPSGETIAKTGNA
jgi:hypothetical protein